VINSPVGVTPVLFPELGINEDAGVVVQWSVGNGDTVQAGDNLCVVETSKTVLDIEAPVSGTVHPIAEIGHSLGVGQLLGLVGDSEAIEAYLRENKNCEFQVDKKSATRSTRKAREYARTHNIELSRVEARDGEIIRESDVARAVEKFQASTKERPHQARAFDTRLPPVLIYGAGNGGKNACEAIKLSKQYEPVCFVDDSELVENEVMGHPVYPSGELNELRNAGVCYGFVAIANGKIRQRIRNVLESHGFHLITIIHPNAYISPSVKIGGGNHIKAGAIIDSGTKIGNGCIIDNGVVIPHDNTLCDDCHLAPGSALGSNTNIGAKSVIGIGAKVSTNINVGEESIIGVGAIVDRDLPAGTIFEAVSGRVTGRRK